MAGVKQRVLRVDVLPLHLSCWGGADPSRVAAPGNSGPNPDKPCQGQPVRILVMAFDKCTHTRTGGCGALEGIIALRT